MDNDFLLFIWKSYDLTIIVLARDMEEALQTARKGLASHEWSVLQGPCKIVPGPTALAIWDNY